MCVGVCVLFCSFVVVVVVVLFLFFGDLLEKQYIGDRSVFVRISASSDVFLRSGFSAVAEGKSKTLK